MMRRDLQPLGSGLEKIIAGSLQKTGRQEVPRLAWPLACGRGVADRTRVLGYTDGTLTVQVADRVWRNELQHLAPNYVAVLNRYCGNTVKRIEFVLSTTHEPLQRWVTSD